MTYDRFSRQEDFVWSQFCETQTTERKGFGLSAHHDELSASPQGRAKPVASSQSTDRVVDILELLAREDAPFSLAEVADELDVHRSIVYRILRTLTDRRLVEYSNGSYRLGSLVLALANAVPSDLRDLSISELTKLTDRFGTTSYVTIEDNGRSVCFQTVEPHQFTPHVTMRPGTWGPMDRGAPAIAMLSGRPEAPDESEPVTRARELGYATSAGSHPAGIQWVASPIRRGTDSRAAIGILFPVDALELETVGQAVFESSMTISRLLGGAAG
jgi:DNA-binding IclR family transcriptional regulator